MRSHTKDFIRNVCEPMIEKFNKYWEDGGSLYMVACILDPRYKLQFISFYFREKEKLESDKLNEKLQNIRIKYAYLLIYYIIIVAADAKIWAQHKFTKPTKIYLYSYKQF